MKRILFLLVAGGMIGGIFIANRQQQLLVGLRGAGVEISQTVPREVERAGIPKRLMVPKLNIDTIVEEVGKTSEGKMDVPVDFDNVGWYQHGVRPGEQGRAVVAGHVDSPQGRAVFYDLEDLEMGDRIVVESDKGEVFEYVVERAEIFEDELFPIGEVFGADDEKRLNLITCEGVFNINDLNYSHRLVIFAKIAE